MAQDAAGMKGIRSRNKDGKLRKKRDDAHAGTIEKKLGVDLDTRSDTHLRTLKRRDGVGSQDALVRKHRR